MPAHPPFIALPDPDATLLAQVRAQYESGEISATQAAKSLGFSRTTLTHRITHKWFWRVPRRLAASKARRSLAEAARIKAPRSQRAGHQKQIPKTELSPKALHRRLMEEIARLMRALEAHVDESGLPTDPERHAKMMGLVVKLQADAARLDELIKPAARERPRDAAADAVNHDPAAAAIDLARLRADLAHKLGEAQSSGADETAGEPDER